MRWRRRTTPEHASPHETGDPSTGGSSLRKSYVLEAVEPRILLSVDVPLDDGLTSDLLDGTEAAPLAATYGFASELRVDWEAGDHPVRSASDTMSGAASGRAAGEWEDAVQIDWGP